LEGMDDGQKTPRGHPNFNSYVKNLRVLVFGTGGRRHTPAARGLEELFPLSWKGFLQPIHAMFVYIARIRLVIHVNNKLISTDFLVEPKFSSHT
jgi:hypothetical protein